ncbi:hypothetical protein GQ55_7G212100 [Panicum hallii var. hallii]|uniref:Uncharacterized protein n=1 Tax=Panicum hallii var. hallii TaxID=1504633 RepID=A0A2T7CXE7_9POAL|nr:hypothetical protein GQ55_7G212100 [Panicum hallii var. hallii]
MLDAAWKEAKTQAPAVLGYLRGVIRAIRSPTSCNEEEAAGFVFRDIVSLVGIGFYLLFSTQLIFRFSTISGTQFYAACLASACGLAMLLADWIDFPDDDEAGTTRDSADDADDTTQQREGAAGEARLDAELDVRESWQLLWVLIIIAFCFDAFLLHVKLGPRPTELALLALWNFEVLSVGRQVELTPDDGEGAEGSAGSVDGAVDKWRRGAMAVLAASGVKSFVVYLALDFYLAALSFLWLCVMADLMLVEEDSFSEMDESGDDEDREAGLAGIGEDITVGADEGADEARAEHYSNTSSSEDEEEAHTSSSEDEEEGCALNEHCDSSEEREQRRGEPDGSSHGSTDEDDSWDLVEIDPEMPAKENCGANRKSSRLLFPWKSAA